VTAGQPIVAPNERRPAGSTDGASATAELAAWATGFRAKRVPDELHGVVRDRLLDYCANVLGGAPGPSAASLSRYARRFSGGVPLPGGSGSAPEMAALVFGAAAHSLESDDTHQPSSSHPGAVVFSTLLPLALATDAAWDSFVTATVAGYEVMCRIGQATGPAAEYSRGFHPTGTVGAFGAAAAAGLLLGGDTKQVTTAMGIAGSMSAGSMSFLTDGSWTKHLHPGWAAHAGIIAAMLGADGYKGPDLVLERPHGYFAGHADEPASPPVTTALGARPFAIERTSTKAHGCCRYEQAALDAILDLRRQHDVTADQVDAVTIGVLAAGWDIIAAPAAEKRRPANGVGAQFSMPFGAAAALLHGRASVHEHTDDAVHDARLHALMDRVECVRDPSLEVDFPQKWPASVEIRLNDGRSVSARVDYPKGDPENPFTTDELAAKLHDLARAVPEAARTAVIAAVGKLSPGTSLRGLGDALALAWPAT
jgi:2-methylcitrate dehydratase PrpD